MPGLVYTAEHKASVTLQVDFIELVAASDQVIRVLSMKVGQDSDPADAQAELMALTHIRASGTYTVGSGGGTGPAAPHTKGAPASGATIGLLNTTQAVVNTGTFTDIGQDSFNWQIGYLYQPTEIEYVDLSPSDALIVPAGKAPADSLDMTVQVTWEELGG